MTQQILSEQETESKEGIEAREVTGVGEEIEAGVETKSSREENKLFLIHERQ